MSLNCMSPWLTGNLYKPTALKVNPVPTVLFEYLKVQSRPGYLCYFFLRHKLQIKRKRKVEPICGSTVLVVDENWRDCLCYGFPEYLNANMQLNSLSSEGVRSTTLMSSGSSGLQPLGRVNLYERNLG